MLLGGGCVVRRGRSGVAALVAICPPAMCVPLSAHAEDSKGPPASPSIASSLPANGDPFGTRASLAALGVTFGINYIGEGFDVVRGGRSRGTTFDGRAEFYSDADMEKIAGWKGATFHVNVFGLHGVGPTTKRVGSIGPVTGVEALETVRLYEIWFEQALLDGKLKIRFGQMSADAEFWLSDAASLFLNGTFGWPAINAANMPQGGPAYPFATPGVRVQFSPNDNVTILAAVFNSLPASPNAADPQRDNRYGTNFRISDPPLAMLEGHFKYDLGLPGKLRLGGWREFNDFTDQRTGAIIDGNYGLYAIVDQQIWKGGEHQRVSVFGRVAGGADKQNVMTSYFDTGIVFGGLVPGRAKDSFGADFGYGRISSQARAGDLDAGKAVIRDYEAVVELNYRAEIVPGWTVAPDFQYIWHPGGHVEDPGHPGAAVADAVVIGARTAINY